MLQTAAAEGCLEVVRLLLGHGVNVNAQGGYYGNALKAASSGGILAFVRQHDGHEAVSASHLKIVRLLQDHGAKADLLVQYLGNAS